MSNQIKNCRNVTGSALAGSAFSKGILRKLSASVIIATVRLTTLDMTPAEERNDQSYIENVAADSSNAEVRSSDVCCSEGVCAVSWKPRRPAA
jgi:hypothetical protein